MKCAIPVIPYNLLDIAASAELGVETQLAYSLQPVQTLGAIQQDTVGQGTLTLNNLFQAPLTGTLGVDVQLVCLDIVSSAVPIQVAVAVVLDDSTTASGLATLNPPQVSQDQSANLPKGIAADMRLFKAGVEVTNTNFVKSITSLISVTGGAPGNKLGFISCPDASSYTVIADILKKDIEVPTSKSVEIPQGYLGARYIKKGRSTVPKLSLTANYTTYGDGIARIHGNRVTIKLETRKDDQVLNERMIIGGCRFTLKLTKPDGDGKAEATADGMFEDNLFSVYV